MQDRYGNVLSISSANALDYYQQGMDCWLSAQPGAVGHYQAALALEPDFALAYAGLARALFLRSKVDAAKQAVAQALRCAAASKVTPRERSHVAIVDLLIKGESAQAFRAITRHAADYPTDALAIQPCSGVFGLIGFSGRVGREAENLAFMHSLARYYTGDWWFESQYAFALCEVGQLAKAQQLNDRAMQANPSNANAAHHQAHLFYELGEVQAGLAELRAWRAGYATHGVLFGHLAWHEALWSLQQGDNHRVQQIMQDELLPDANTAPPLNILTDLVSLLLRLTLADQQGLESFWRLASQYAADHFSKPGISFADAHCAITHAITGHQHAQTLLPAMATAHPAAGIKQPIAGAAPDLVQHVAQSFQRFAQQDWVGTLASLSPAMAQHERLGGSRAQRDLLELTYAYALARSGQAAAANRWHQARRPVLAAQTKEPI